MVAAQIIVVAKGGIAAARFPVARGLHAARESTILQYRQGKAAAVPGDEIRGVLFNAVEEALDELFFIRGRSTQTPQAQLLAAAPSAGDGDHAMLLEGEKIAPRFLAAVREHGLGDGGVAQSLQGKDAPPELNVRNRLNIEN